jgi:hypothetical protein
VIIETLDGRSYTGATLTDAIEEMRASAWAVPSDTLLDYMKGVSFRTLQWNESVVRYDTIEHFVEDLVAAGILVMRTPS